MKHRDLELLRAALALPEADAAPLLRRVPAMMAEAERRRLADPASVAFSAARTVLPRLGWATAAALVLAAAAWSRRPPAPAPRAASPSAWEDQLILSGTVAPNSADTLVRALADDDPADATGGPR